MFVYKKSDLKLCLDYRTTRPVRGRIHLFYYFFDCRVWIELLRETDQLFSVGIVKIYHHIYIPDGYLTDLMTYENVQNNVYVNVRKNIPEPLRCLLMLH